MTERFEGKTQALQIMDSFLKENSTDEAAKNLHAYINNLINSTEDNIDMQYISKTISLLQITSDSLINDIKNNESKHFKIILTANSKGDVKLVMDIASDCERNFNKINLDSALKNLTQLRKHCITLNSRLAEVL